MVATCLDAVKAEGAEEHWCLGSVPCTDGETEAWGHTPLGREGEVSPILLAWPASIMNHHPGKESIWSPSGLCSLPIPSPDLSHCLPRGSTWTMPPFLWLFQHRSLCFETQARGLNCPPQQPQHPLGHCPAGQGKGKKPCRNGNLSNFLSGFEVVSSCSAS